MKILFFGDMAATGFGTVTVDLGRRLIDLGEDVRFVSLNETPTLDEPFASRTLSVLSLETVTDDEGFIARLMRGESPYRLWNGELWGEWRPDAAIILGDFVAARAFVGQHLDAFREVPTYHYCPIEGVDLPPLWNELWSVVKPVAMSEFGAKQIEKVTGEHPPMIYHGVDTQTFYPVSRDTPIVFESEGKPRTVITTRKGCRRAFLPGPVDDDHPILKEVWILRTDRHMPRKRYPSMIRALAPVLRRHRNVRMVIHCNPMDQGGYLWDDISKYPDVRDQYLLTDAMRWLWPVNEEGIPLRQPFTRPILNALYNACDLYLSTSAEGFGLTVAEAIATGIPAVGLNYSAIPEVIGPAGVTVPVGYLFDNEYSHQWAAVDEEAMGQAVEFLVTHQTRRTDLGRQGPPHVRTRFSWDQAARDFLALLLGSLETRAA